MQVESLQRFYIHILFELYIVKITSLCPFIYIEYTHTNLTKSPGFLSGGKQHWFQLDFGWSINHFKIYSHRIQKRDTQYCIYIYIYIHNQIYIKQNWYTEYICILYTLDIYYIHTWMQVYIGSVVRESRGLWKVHCFWYEPNDFWTENEFWDGVPMWVCIYIYII